MHSAPRRVHWNFWPKKTNVNRQRQNWRYAFSARIKLSQKPLNLLISQTQQHCNRRRNYATIIRWKMDFQYRILNRVVKVLKKKSCTSPYNVSTCMFTLLNIRYVFSSLLFFLGRSFIRSFVVPHQRGIPPTAIVKWCVFHGWIGKDTKFIHSNCAEFMWVCVHICLCAKRNFQKIWMNEWIEEERSINTHQNNNNASNWSWRWNNIVACIIWRCLHFVAATHTQRNTLISRSNGTRTSQRRVNLVSEIT